MARIICACCGNEVDGVKNFVLENNNSYCSDECYEDSVNSGNEQPFIDDEPADFIDDVQADADALANIGWGMDEDYGVFDGYDGMDYDFGMHDD